MEVAEHDTTTNNMVRPQQAQDVCTDSCSIFNTLGLEIKFPYTPYGIQKAMLSKITNILKNKEHILIDSPTGTGKTLVLLSAVLEWQHKSKLLGKPFLSEKFQPSIVSKRRSLSSAGSNKILALDGCDRNRLEPSNDRFPIRVESAPIVVLDENGNELNPLVTSGCQSLCVKDAAAAAAAAASTSCSTKIPSIYYCTRTHGQITQVSSELAKLEFAKSRHLKMSILSGRDRTCVNEKLKKHKSRDEKCAEIVESSRMNVSSGNVRQKFGCQKDKICKYYTGSRNIAQVYRKIYNQNSKVWDIEDAVKFGLKTKTCPYYGIRSLHEGANIIFAPYNYLIDPNVRDSLNIDLSDSIIIFDEAHNIEDVCRASASFTINSEQIKLLINLLTKLLKKNSKLVTICSSLSYFKQIFSSIKAFMAGAKFSEPLQQLDDVIPRQEIVFVGDNLITAFKTMDLDQTCLSKFIDHLNILKGSKIVGDEETTTTTNEIVISKPKKGRSSTRFRGASRGIQQHQEAENDTPNLIRLLTKLRIVLEFIYKVNDQNWDHYNLVMSRTLTKSKSKLTHGLHAFGLISAKTSLEMSILCLNPGIAFESLNKLAWSIIVASGTLAPMESLKSELNCQFAHTFEGSHVITSGQIFASSLAAGPNNVQLNCAYTNSIDAMFKKELGLTIKGICDLMPNGILCFFPSYERLHSLKTEWDASGIMEAMQKDGRKVFVEQRGLTVSEAEKQVLEYSEAAISASGAIMFAVFRGNMSEGIDFAGKTARAVITIGIPFANPNELSVKLKKVYNDKMKGAGRSLVSGNDWYVGQAFRALNQALGRCIRSKNDWGAIIMIDSRLGSEYSFSNVTKWLRHHLTRATDYNEMLLALATFLESKQN